MENFKNILKKKSADFSIRFLKGRPINLFLPIAIILTIIPLIVRNVSVRLDSTTADIYGYGIQSDLFSQKKAYFLIRFSIILLIISVIFFKRVFKRKDKIVNSILISTCVFLLFTLLSAIFSEHSIYAINGAFDRAEGLITIACYIILFVYSIYTFKTTNDYKYVFIPMLILVAILSFLGVFQYIGKDLLTSKLGTYIAVGDASDSKISLLYQTGKLYGTLYHYNYVGSFVAIVLPILFSLAIFKKKVSMKIILGIGSLLSVWLLFGSTSRAGIIGILVAAIFAIIIFGRLIFKRWKLLVISIVSVIVITVGLNFATNGIIFQRIPALVTDSFSIFKDTSNFDYREHTPVKDIKNVDNHIEVILPTETLKISAENNNYVFRNSKDEIINYTINNDVYLTDNTSFNNISFTTQKISNKSKIPDYLYLSINDQPQFVFKMNKDGSVHLVSPNSHEDIDIAYPETIRLFTGKEKLGSARAYIWSRSIPLIKDNLVIGSGPDTFIYQFPQNDLIGKYYAYDTPNMIIDKPHNLYLQIALNDGLIALLAFIVIMVIYIIDSMKLYALKKEYNESQILGGATCLGVIGYLFAGIFNDSVISVAPIFWIVLGVGVALNFMNRKANN